MNKTYQIQSTKFTAHIILNKYGVVTHAAPPVEFMSGWYTSRVQTYVSKMAWRIAEVEPVQPGEGDRVTG